MNIEPLTYKQISSSELQARLDSYGLAEIRLTSRRASALIGMYEAVLRVEQGRKLGYSKARRDWHLFLSMFRTLQIALLHPRLFDVLAPSVTQRATLGWEQCSDGTYLVGLLSGAGRSNNSLQGRRP